MNLRTIDVYLITGFLGAGKTTFLRQLLDQVNIYTDLKCGILVNEFGIKNVDNTLLAKKGINLIEIVGGSIFCSCLHTEFIQALHSFYTDTEINTLFIETSGLSNPSMIFKDLNIANKQIGNVYKIKESICIVDASLIIKLMDVVNSIIAQLQVSSYVLINKIDLVNSKELKVIENKIQQINQDILVFKTNCGKFDLKTLLDQKKTQIAMELIEIRDKKGNYSSLYLSQSGEMSKAELNHFLETLDALIIRVKGYVNCGEEGWFRVDQVGKNIILAHTANHSGNGELIIISEENDTNEIKSRWPGSDS
jgi:G3E family GTPase